MPGRLRGLNGKPLGRACGAVYTIAMDASTVLNVLIIVALAGVVGALALGVIAMFRGGEFNRKYGNKLMRWRVGLQATVVGLLLILWLVNR